MSSRRHRGGVLVPLSLLSSVVTSSVSDQSQAGVAKVGPGRDEGDSRVSTPNRKLQYGETEVGWRGRRGGVGTCLRRAKREKAVVVDGESQTKTSLVGREA